MKLEKLNELLNVTSADCFFAFEAEQVIVAQRSVRKIL